MSLLSEKLCVGGLEGGARIVGGGVVGGAVVLGVEVGGRVGCTVIAVGVSGIGAALGVAACAVVSGSLVDDSGRDGDDVGGEAVVSGSLVGAVVDASQSAVGAGTGAPVNSHTPSGNE